MSEWYDLTESEQGIVDFYTNPEGEMLISTNPNSTIMLVNRFYHLDTGDSIDYYEDVVRYFTIPVHDYGEEL